MIIIDDNNYIDDNNCIDENNYIKKYLKGLVGIIRSKILKKI